jgi:hypothetical protein
MARKKVTVTFDLAALELVTRAAQREGVPVSTWLSRAARREAVRTGAASRPDEALDEALTDERELQLAGEDPRAAG